MRVSVLEAMQIHNCVINIIVSIIFNQIIMWRAYAMSLIQFSYIIIIISLLYYSISMQINYLHAL